MRTKSNVSKTKSGLSDSRAPIPPDVRQQVLRRSRRRCCVCFGLKGDLGVKEGQIAHLDRNRSNPLLENLAFLCQACHTQYDKKSNRVLGYTPEEVRYYRDILYEKLGDDRIEWKLTIRVHRTQYEEARTAVDIAKAILLGLSRDVEMQEGPVDLK